MKVISVTYVERNSSIYFFKKISWKDHFMFFRRVFIDTHFYFSLYYFIQFLYFLFDARKSHSTLRMLKVIDNTISLISQLNNDIRNTLQFIYQNDLFSISKNSIFFSCCNSIITSRKLWIQSRVWLSAKLLCTIPYRFD